MNRLTDKLNREWENYIAELMLLPPKEIIKRAYETAWKEEIMTYLLSCVEITDKKIEILLKRENLLNEMYRVWMDTDGDYNELLGFAIKNRILELAENK